MIAYVLKGSFAGALPWWPVSHKWVASQTSGHSETPHPCGLARVKRVVLVAGQVGEPGVPGAPFQGSFIIRWGRSRGCAPGSAGAGLWPLAEGSSPNVYPPGEGGVPAQPGAKRREQDHRKHVAL
jgi:hypothetical protein